jgi:hypothetical protein
MNRFQIQPEKLHPPFWKITAHQMNLKYKTQSLIISRATPE